MRLYTPDDYETVKQWWQAWGWPPIPEETLPKIGVIVDGKACAWLYQTDSRLAFMEWFITSKQREGREDAKQAVIHGITGIAKEMGYKDVVTFIRNPNLIATHISCDFKVTDENVKVLTRSM